MLYLNDICIIHLSPLVPSVLSIGRLTKILISIYEGTSKYFFMSVATISRKMKRAYLKLCLEKRQEKEPRQKWVKKMKIFNLLTH